jgi:hypothetical protein
VSVGGLCNTDYLSSVSLVHFSSLFPSIIYYIFGKRARRKQNEKSSDFLLCSFRFPFNFIFLTTLVVVDRGWYNQPEINDGEESI